MRRILLAALLLACCLSPAISAPAGVQGIEFRTLDGKPVHLGDLLAQGPVLICVFKTWCSTSVDALGKMRTFQTAYADRSKTFHVLAVGHNKAESLARFEARHKLDWVTMLEDPPPYAGSRLLGARQTPTLVLLGPDGAVLARVGAWDRAAYNAVSKQIAGLLGLPYAAISTPGDGMPETKPGCVLVDTPELEP